jgi:hypothetical protein
MSDNPPFIRINVHCFRSVGRFQKGFSRTTDKPSLIQTSIPPFNDDSLTAASSGKDASGEASLHAAVTNDL